MTSLYNLILQSSEGDDKATIEILKKFHPLLNKYTKKLNYECANTDLVIALLEIINSLSKYDKSIFMHNETPCGVLVNSRTNLLFLSRIITLTFYHPFFDARDCLLR